VRAGFAVTTIDAFADLDLHPSVRSQSLPRDVGVRFSADAAARASRDVPAEVAVYVSNFENHPDAVSRLAAGRTLWGNPPSVLRTARDPWQLAEVFGRRGIPTPALRLETSSPARGTDDSGSPNDPNAPDVPSGWLVKPLSSGGGHGVRPWTGGAVPRGCYLQQRIDGVPGSVVFVAAGGRAVSLGVSRQIVGDPAFGAEGYRYCGNILAPAGDAQFAGDEALFAATAVLAAAAAEGIGLVGLNGIDVVAAGSIPYPIELNPRWCASMELVERAYGVSVFASHAAACATGTLPTFDVRRLRRAVAAVGKAIVYARRDMTMGETRGWLDDPTVRDVPHPGERIGAGHPICTVLAEGIDSAACYAALVERAARVYGEPTRPAGS
jgi:predicted ATP-grasp superfamily ATP-dependent carboligase